MKKGGDLDGDVSTARSESGTLCASLVFFIRSFWHRPHDLRCEAPRQRPEGSTVVVSILLREWLEEIRNAHQERS